MTSLIKTLWYYQKLKIPNNNKFARKEIIVLGMHRSGTSLVAGWLNIMGVNMGQDLHGPSDANIKGFFEDTELKTLNEEILKNCGGSWDKPPSEKKILLCSNKLKEKVKKTIQKKSQFDMWGWKDPRTVLTIRLYMEYLNNPYFMFCFRNPLAVALSLHKRENRSITEGIFLANTYNQRIIKLLYDYPNINKYFLNYEQACLNPEQSINLLINFIGLKPTLAIYYNALRFLTGNLNIFDYDD